MSFAEAPLGLRLPPLASPLVPSRNAHETYEKLNRLQEGTYGVVYRARDRKSGRVVAMKRIKLDDARSGFPTAELREIRALSKLKACENIVDLIEVVVGRSLNSVYLVMEYVEHDLHQILSRMAQGKTARFTPAQAKCVVADLLRGLDYLHENWFMHRDIKPSNLLYGNNGVLRIGDFGLARECGTTPPPPTVVVEASHLPGEPPQVREVGPYTGGVVTLWYRAPEVLLGSESYDGAPVDVWAAGCVMAEILLCVPLLRGAGQLDQITKMFSLLGTPDEAVWPGYEDLPHVRRATLPSYSRGTQRLRERVSSELLSNTGFQLLCELLSYNPHDRFTASEALRHPWFVQERPPPSHPSVMPGWPEAFL
jgi:cell division cycle 2-like